MKASRFILGILSLFILIGGLFFSSRIVEHNSNSEFLILEYPRGGIDAFFQGGMYMQYFGTAVHFPRSQHLWFSKDKVRGSDNDESLPMNFNDSGHGNVSGGVQVDFPTDHDKLIDLYRTYRTPENVMNSLIRPALEKAAYVTGPLMTSIESAAEKRSQIPLLIEDQAANGVYQTEVTYKQEEDPLTKQIKTVARVVFTQGKDGNKLRQEDSPLVRFGIRLYNLTMDGIIYDTKTQANISLQQDAKMQIQQKITDARKAEQDAITAEANGRAQIAKAKADQETINATEIAKVQKDNSIRTSNQETAKQIAESQAEQQKNVAALTAQQNELEAKGKLALAQAEAQGNKLKLEANNGLDLKLQALVRIAEANATAFSSYKGNLVPSVVLSGGTGSTASTPDLFNSVLQMRLAESAKQLGVDLALDRPAANK